LIEEYSTIVAPSQDAKVAYLTNDHLGSPRINTDATGAVTARHDYHPFGEEIATPQRAADLGYIDDTVRKQFTGYERDDETNLDFAKNRYHNFDLGRFSSPDPYKIVAEIKFEKTEEKAASMLRAYISEPQKWNQYSYTINNPLRYTDPTGEEIWLRGTKEEQAEAEALLKEILGKERWAFVKGTIRSDGSAIVLNIDRKDVEAFSKIGDDIHNKALSEGMAHILSSVAVLDVRMDGNAENMQGKLVDVDKFRENPMEPEADAGYVPYSININKHAQAVIGPETVAKAYKIQVDEIARGGSGLATDGTALRFTKASALAHEIGHHWKRRGGGDGSVAFENAVRSRTSQRLRRAHN
jgi:RHS repeat-associated protein